MKKSSVIFHKGRIAAKIKKALVEEQTKRLIIYADNELRKMVESHEFWNKTYNLEDSYVWAVFYNGKKEKHGFYSNKVANKTSILHEWGSKEKQKTVNGRKAARDFVNGYTPSILKGWEVVWAACAPYGAYLEAGFTIKKSGKYLQFDVIAQRFDYIKRELEPQAKVRFEISFPS